MRVRVLVSLSLLLIIGVSAAAARGQQVPSSTDEQAATQMPPVAESYDLFRAPDTSRQFAPLTHQAYRIKSNDLPTSRPLVPLTDESGCYTMRTYIVAREDKSDITRPAGYVECVPGNRVKMKSAVGPQQ